MDSYETLAPYYDRFTDDVGYERWADYLEALFRHMDAHPRLVLDLACGTGTMTALLASRGYDLIGVDASEEMLSQAFQRTVELTPRPLLLHQRMEALELYGPVDACICCLDSVNYVTDPAALAEAFRRVYGSLTPGGVFVFDVNTPKKFQEIAGQSYVREDGDVYCVWQCLLEGALCTYDFDIFEYAGKNRWTRAKETHLERVYEPDVLADMLRAAGFSAPQVYPELGFGPVTGEEQRLFFAVQKGKDAL